MSPDDLIDCITLYLLHKYQTQTSKEPVTTYLKELKNNIKPNRIKNNEIMYDAKHGFVFYKQNNQLFSNITEI